MGGTTGMTADAARAILDEWVSSGSKDEFIRDLADELEERVVRALRLDERLDRIEVELGLPPLPWPSVARVVRLLPPPPAA